MIGYLFAGIALAGSTWAAIEDLKTTEVPDKIPYAMAVSAVTIRLFYSLHTGDFSHLTGSLLVGAVYLAFGFLLYYSGQWGGGDAKMLAAVGVLLPSLPPEFGATMSFPFPLAYLVNLFFFGSMYMIFYSLVISLLHPKVAGEFFLETKGNYVQVFFEVFFAVCASILVPFIASRFGGLPQASVYSLTLPLLALLLAMLFLFRFLRVVERVAFRKKVTSDRLREGDMLGEDIGELGMKSRLIKGLAKEEVEKIREVRKEVWIKEGVRFVPAFPISLAVTLLYGDVSFILSTLF